MRGRTILISVAICLLGIAPLAFASQSNLDARSIREQQQQIRSEAEARNGRYKDLSEEKRSELFSRLAQVSNLLKEVTLTTELKEAEQIELSNALESISAIVNAAEDDRMVCERSRPVGSNRMRTVCKTVAQRRIEREAARGGLDRHDP